MSRLMLGEFRETFRARGLEWCFATVLFLWGLLLLGPSETFSHPAFAEPRRFVSENTLGWIFLAGGSIRLAALAINGAWRPTPHIRAWMAASSAAVWMQITLWFLSAGTHGTGLAVYPVFFGFEILNALRAAGDAAASDRTARARRERAGAGPTS